MQAIESFEHLYAALSDIVSAHTSLDRKQIADAIAEALAGHPREAAIKLLLDGLCAGSHNLAGRLAAAAEIKELVHKYDEAPEPVATLGPVSFEGSAGTSEAIEIPPPKHCNHIDITRGPCTLAYGHDGDHVWTNPDAQPIEEYLDEARAKVEAAGGFKPIDAAAQVSERLLDQAEPAPESLPVASLQAAHDSLKDAALEVPYV